MKPTSILLVLTTLGVVSLSAQTHSVTKKWESEASLKVPESVLFDAERKVLYVTNIDGEPWGRDGRGSVGKLGLDGKVIAVEWVTGLNAPKGMALRGERLYLADLDEVVVIDVEKGRISERIRIEGAKGLNDVTIDAQGVVFVSDSHDKKVYAVKAAQPKLILQDLRGPNGVLSHEGTLYVADGQGLYRVGADAKPTLIADGMDGGIDGVEPVGGGDFLVSCWRGVLHYVKADGGRETLFDTRADKINAADIGYDPQTRTVYVPTFFNNTVVAYELK